MAFWSKSEKKLLQEAEVSEHYLVNDAIVHLRFVGGYIKRIDSAIIILKGASGVSLTEDQLTSLKTLLTAIGDLSSAPMWFDHHVSTLRNILKKEKRAVHKHDSRLGDAILKRERVLYQEEHELYNNFVSYTEKFKEWLSIAQDARSKIMDNVEMKRTLGNSIIFAMKTQVLRIESARKMDFVSVGKEILQKLEGHAHELEETANQLSV